MSAQIVNPVPSDELPGWTHTLCTTFLTTPDPEVVAQYTRIWCDRLAPERTWGAREHGRWVATLATEERTITVPAADGATAELPVDALTGVTTAATHRRQGLLRTMIGRSADAARERGDAVSVLVAAEWPIYGRYGYGPATQAADYEYLPRARGAAISPAPGGAVREVTASELRTVAPAVFASHRRLRAGQIDRPPFYTTHSLADKPIEGHYVSLVHETDGVADGTLTWRPAGVFDLSGSFAQVKVGDLVAATPTAYRNFWAYLSGLDVVETVRLRNCAVDEPARWLMANGRALRQTYAGDFLWLRFLDVRAALAARHYATPGRLVLDLLDDGVVLLEGGPDGATCSPTTLSPDVRLPARVLARAYLGGYRLSALPAGVDEISTGALARLDAMFATPLAPWCQTGF